MKIEAVFINNRKKCLEIETPKGRLALPFSKLRLQPTEDNKITEAYVDDELGRMAVTYTLASREEESLHLDAFLDYNKDPEYMRRMTLYKLTLSALEAIKISGLSKREIARKLSTSPAQLYRLLDTANYQKTIDQMVKLLTALDYKVDFELKEDSPTEAILNKLKDRFPYLKEEDLSRVPISSSFKPLALAYSGVA